MQTLIVIVILAQVVVTIYIAVDDQRHRRLLALIIIAALLSGGLTFIQSNNAREDAIVTQKKLSAANDSLDLASKEITQLKNNLNSTNSKLDDAERSRDALKNELEQQLLHNADLVQNNTNLISSQTLEINEITTRQRLILEESTLIVGEIFKLTEEVSLQSQSLEEAKNNIRGNLAISKEEKELRDACETSGGQGIYQNPYCPLGTFQRDLSDQ